MVTVLLALTIAVQAFAAERATVCAKYRAGYGWSNGYKVKATILKGRELNTATRSLTYNGLATYVVIFWDEGEASVIEMGTMYLTPMGQEGVDQQGRTWQVAKTSFCY